MVHPWCMFQRSRVMDDRFDGVMVPWTSMNAAYAGAMEATTEATELPDHRDGTAMDTEGEAAVGRIALWCAWLEQALVDLCAKLINDDNARIGYAVTANMSASGMVQLAKTLISGTDSLSEQSKAEALAILTDAKVALERRNGVLHSVVGGSFVEGKAAFSNGKRKTFKVGHPQAGNQMYVLLGFEELDEIGASIYKTMNDLYSLDLQINSLP